MQVRFLVLNKGVGNKGVGSIKPFNSPTRADQRGGNHLAQERKEQDI